MEIESYGSICVEGGDQVGKGAAALGLRTELREQGINVTYASFPIYATPLGSAIRMMIKEGCPDDVVDKENDIETRMALFAINRLEYLDVFLSDEKYKDTLLVFDRSPFSNAVTIGYGMAKGDSSEVDKYIEKALDFDGYMISTLGLDRCVVQLQKEWEGSRSIESDEYEKADVQEKCMIAYGKLKDIVGEERWSNITTKVGDEWVDKSEIRSRILDILSATYGDMDDIRHGKEYQIDFKEIVSKIYPRAIYQSNVCFKYACAVKENYKDGIYCNAVVLGREVGESCSSIRFSNPAVRSEINRIISQVPEVLKVYEYFLGEDFVDKLIKGIKNDKERISEGFTI